MFIFSVQIIIVPDNQSKLQMLTLFSGGHIGVPYRNTNMAVTY